MTIKPIWAAPLFLAACADMGANYDPILDGAPGANYATDLTACQDLARDQSFGDEVIGATVAGALFGGALADHEGDASPGEGALAGALAGFVTASFDVVERRQSIVVECMRGRGHRVAG